MYVYFLSLCQCFRSSSSFFLHHLLLRLTISFLPLLSTGYGSSCSSTIHIGRNIEEKTMGERIDSCASAILNIYHTTTFFSSVFSSLSFLCPLFVLYIFLLSPFCSRYGVRSNTEMNPTLLKQKHKRIELANFAVLTPTHYLIKKNIINKNKFISFTKIHCKLKNNVLLCSESVTNLYRKCENFYQVFLKVC